MTPWSRAAMASSASRTARRGRSTRQRPIPTSSPRSSCTARADRAPGPPAAPSLAISPRTTRTNPPRTSRSSSAASRRQDARLSYTATRVRVTGSSSRTVTRTTATRRSSRGRGQSNSCGSGSARSARRRSGPTDSEGSARLVVDLRLLEPAAEVDVDRLPLRVGIERRVACLAVPVPGLLPAAEREMGLGANGAGVDIHDPGLEVAHRAERGVHVLGEDRGRETVPCLVHDGGRRRVVVDRDHSKDGSEDLLLADAIHRLDVAEDGRLEEMAVSERAIGDPVTADDELALGPADLDVALDLLHRGAAHQRTDVGRRLEPVAEPQALRARRDPVDELVHDRPFRDDTRARRASLAGRAERRPHDAVDGEVEIGIAEDDDRVLAAELEAHPL